MGYVVCSLGALSWIVDVDADEDVDMGVSRLWERKSSAKQVATCVVDDRLTQ
jgi:hypothetical protein